MNINYSTKKSKNILDVFKICFFVLLLLFTQHSACAIAGDNSDEISIKIYDDVGTAFKDLIELAKQYIEDKTDGDGNIAYFYNDYDDACNNDGDKRDNKSIKDKRIQRMVSTTQNNDTTIMCNGCWISLKSANLDQNITTYITTKIDELGSNTNSIKKMFNDICMKICKYNEEFNKRNTIKEQYGPIKQKFDVAQTKYEIAKKECSTAKQKYNDAQREYANVKKCNITQKEYNAAEKACNVAKEEYDAAKEEWSQCSEIYKKALIHNELLIHTEDAIVLLLLKQIIEQINRPAFNENKQRYVVFVSKNTMCDKCLSKIQQLSKAYNFKFILLCFNDFREDLATSEFCKYVLRDDKNGILYCRVKSLSKPEINEDIDNNGSKYVLNNCYGDCNYNCMRAHNDLQIKNITNYYKSYCIAFYSKGKGTGGYTNKGASLSPIIIQTNLTEDDIQKCIEGGEYKLSNTQSLVYQTQYTGAYTQYGNQGKEMNVQQIPNQPG